MKRGQSGFIKGPSEPDPIDQRTRIIPDALSAVKTLECFAKNDFTLRTSSRTKYEILSESFSIETNKLKARRSQGIVRNF